jgi:hypothetical protein
LLPLLPLLLLLLQHASDSHLGFGRQAHKVLHKGPRLEGIQINERATRCFLYCC